ncbi:MAG: NAD(P)/FAD-dependent oxidoreductase [Desulfuromonas sp.]|nr:NAD(P)/FAD-dependent oxidoreductase [Desulfuromonas sp.]
MLVNKEIRCFRLREVALNVDEEETLLASRVAEYLQIAVEQIQGLHVVRQGIDARRKGRVLRVYTVEFLTDDASVLLRCENDPRLICVVDAPAAIEIQRTTQPKTVVVVGMGPAGLFAALTLAQAGHQVCLVERGKPVEQRVVDVESFWNGGALQHNSNVQFGEGGAGTFSDGKLTTRIKHPLTRRILQTLVDFGAPEQILVQAKPHIGTDRLRQVLIRFRRELQQLGVELRYESCLTGLDRQNGVLTTARINDRDELPCAALVLAVGHSARDTYAMLDEQGVRLEAKPFAIGVRIEHPAALINRIQFGHSNHPRLPTADYALTFNDRQSGRGIYSFCMCPGGQVVQSSSESEMVVVNGMSDYCRAGSLSNSALVVSVRPEDFADDTPLAGVRFQQHWERQAFLAGGGDYRPPAQNLMAFLGRKKGGQLVSSCRPGVRSAELTQTLPDFVSDGLKQALPHFERKMRGFITTEATLIGVETRTSAPLRIVRDGHGQSVNCPGLYPAGEGAGYAGGIMSAALDGMQIALTIHGQE